MSRETLLDDAIAKAKEAEDWQLVEWLRMARGGESAARWYTAKLSEARLDISNLMAENAKLRKYVAWLEKWALDHAGFGMGAEVQFELDMARRELGIEVDE